MSDFRLVTIGEIASVRSGYAFKSSEWVESGVPVVKIANVKSGRLAMDKCSFVSVKSADNAAEFSLDVGDICISMTGYVGEVAVVQSNDIPAVLNQRVGKFFLHDRNKVDPRYFYFAVTMPEIRREFEALGYGSAQPNVSPKLIQNVKISLPPFDIQKSISDLLGSLDDKIDLNRRTNQTLEIAARALFQEWFVDFGPVRAKAEGCQPGGLSTEMAALFPDLLDEEGKPEGWMFTSFAETVEIIGGGTPKTSVSSYWNGDIPWFSVVDAPNTSDIWVMNTEKTITERGLADCSSRLLLPGTTIISARGTVGRVALVGKPMAMNQSCYGLTGKSDTHGSYTYLMTRSLVDRLRNNAHGSVFDTITRETFSGISVMHPPKATISAFESLVQTLFERTRKNLLENTVLTELRDLLLPKLMSGEIRVKDADRLAEQAA